MSTKLPEKQHYIPQMILKHFADDRDLLWVGHRDTGHVFCQGRHKTFVQKNLYTRYSYEDGSPDAEYERRLSDIESEASRVLDRIVDEVRNHCVQNVGEQERLAVQRFVFSLARRTPESQRRVSGNQDDKEVFFQAAATLPGYMENVGALDEDSLFDIDGVPALAKKVLHNVNADFAADSRSDLRLQEQQFCAGTKLLFGLLETSDHELVIGSHGITITRVLTPSSSHSTVSETLLPIAPDVIVRIASLAQDDSLRIITSGRTIERINRSTLRLSEWIAGRSRSVISSLVAA
ncbi:MAG: DUF4238 domain-containing protein [Acidimicrobiia bacterium]|nr:DUF4238 domain-containing protein [Acidimicrobiia bacterium]